ncbi:hypothetical protein F511_39619 [Dorcoceras hygrometricum]|uniref:Dystroglycan-like n=1 Tax=Dorcoceras hygrometricum TaxID=472368 RepID=A0A2Z7DCE5_9LAMI|nr:hypothetical protein F511_39619 [Dorcoceras hygrometricum]
MASSLISSSHHIDFDSIFCMEDASLAPMFESLITTGLKEFLGCPAIFYEAALTEFFANGSVRDGVVVSTIGGTAVEISESVFAATFELPSEVNSRHWEALPQRPYLDDLAPLCVFIEPVQDIDSRPSLSRAISIVWAEICMEAVQFSLLGSLRPVGSVNFCGDLVVRGSVVEVLETLPNRFRRIIRQGIDEVDLVSSEGSTVYRSPSPIFQETDSFDHNLRFALGPAIPVVAQAEQFYYVDSPEFRPPTSPRQETSASSSSDSPVHLNGDDIPLEEDVNVQTTFPAATADLSPLLDDMKTSLSQRMDNAHSDILSRLHTIERGLQNTLGHQNDYFRNLIQNARQEGQNQDDLQILRLNELKKTVMAQGVTADTDSLAVRNRFNVLDANIILLDGQIGDLVDYIRGGDAKKGEGSSSRRPLPTPVNQGESSGNVIRI